MIRSTLSSLRDWREYLTPVNHVSSFKKTGEITPEEFITAGDYLVYKFPTWSWYVLILVWLVKHDGLCVTL